MLDGWREGAIDQQRDDGGGGATMRKKVESSGEPWCICIDD